MSVRDCVTWPRSSSSESSVSSDSSVANEYLRANAFSGHRDTLARIKFSPRTPRPDADEDESSTEGFSGSSLGSLYDRSQSFPDRRAGFVSATELSDPPRLPHSLPPSVFQLIIHHLSHDDYRALRLTCRSWLAALPPLTLPASPRLPDEVIRQIYQHLSPLDFDAARHTCKSWLLASLDTNLLISMLRRAGCWFSARADLHRQQKLFEAKKWSRLFLGDGVRMKDMVKEECVLSLRLAYECRSSTNWRGNAATASTTPGSKDPRVSAYSHLPPPPPLTPNDQITFSEFKMPPKDGGDCISPHESSSSPEEAQVEMRQKSFLFPPPSPSSSWDVRSTEAKEELHNAGGTVIERPRIQFELKEAGIRRLRGRGSGLFGMKKDF